jgi:hypothetical protein
MSCPRLLFIGMLGAAALAASDVGPAESAADVRREVIRAFTTASSFRATISVPNAYDAWFTFVKPHRLKSMTRYHGLSSGEHDEMVAIDTTVYHRTIDGGPWYRSTEKDAYGPDVAAPGIFRGDSLVPLPDRREHGRMVGAFDLRLSGPTTLPKPSVIMTCSYDKATYRLHRCDSSLPFTVIYDGWNDRANVVIAPLA